LRGHGVSQGVGGTRKTAAPLRLLGTCWRTSTRSRIRDEDAERIVAKEMATSRGTSGAKPSAPRRCWRHASSDVAYNILIMFLAPLFCCATANAGSGRRAEHLEGLRLPLNRILLYLSTLTLLRCCARAVPRRRLFANMRRRGCTRRRWLADRLLSARGWECASHAGEI